MITVFSLSHMAFLLALPAGNNPAGGSMGLLMYLVFLTEINDVAQYLWDKRSGRIKIAPRVSPNKTLAGALGGMITATLLAGPASAWLTPLSMWEGLGSGMLISIAGIAGDLTIWALKRPGGQGQRQPPARPRRAFRPA